MASPLTATVASPVNLSITPNKFTLLVNSSVAGFPDAGYLFVMNSAGALQIVYYGDKGTNSFTQCSGGTGTVLSGAPVIQAYSTTASGAQSLPSETIYVTSTANIPSAAGVVWINVSSTSIPVWQAVYYTGAPPSSGGAQLTGCVGGSGPIPNGNAVVLGLQTFGSSSAQTLPSSGRYTLHVTSRAAFPHALPLSGSAGGLGLLTSAGYQVVGYTDLGPTSFTGCTGGTGTLPANGVVIGLFSGFGPQANMPAVVQDYVQLRSIPAPANGTTVQVLGAHAPGDGGDGVFAWDQNSPPTGALNDNLGLVLQSFTTTTGCWRRIGSQLVTNSTGFSLDTGPQEINPCWFGAVGDGTTDNTAAFQAALDVLAITGGTLRIPAGIFKMTSVTAGVVLPYATIQTAGIPSGSTITVNSTAGFPVRGTLQVSTGDGFQVITYTGITTSPPYQFTGCLGGQGSFPANSQFSLLNGGVRIVGSGAQTILSFAISGSTPGLTLQGSYTTVENLTITSTGTTTQPAVHIAAHTEGLKVSEVVFSANPGGALSACDFLIDVLFEKCKFAGNAGVAQPVTAQIIGNNSTTIAFRKCYFSNNFDVYTSIACGSNGISLDRTTTIDVASTARSPQAVNYPLRPVPEFRRSLTPAQRRQCLRVAQEVSERCPPMGRSRYTGRLDCRLPPWTDRTSKIAFLRAPAAACRHKGEPAPELKDAILRSAIR
jgi:hypothetical protein